MTTRDKAKGSSLLGHSCLGFCLCGEQQGQNKLRKDAHEEACAGQQEGCVREDLLWKTKQLRVLGIWLFIQ